MTLPKLASFSVCVDKLVGHKISKLSSMSLHYFWLQVGKQIQAVKFSCSVSFLLRWIFSLLVLST